MGRGACQRARGSCGGDRRQGGCRARVSRGVRGGLPAALLRAEGPRSGGARRDPGARRTGVGDVRGHRAGVAWLGRAAHAHPRRRPWDDGQGGLNPTSFYEKYTYVAPQANLIGTIKEFYGRKTYIPTFTAPNYDKISGSSGFTITYDPDNSQIEYDASPVLRQGGGVFPRLFTGTAIPSTINNTRIGDFYLRVDYSIPVYQLYVKQNNGGGTSVWTLIGP